jgi:hypothetical protein
MEYRQIDIAPECGGAMRVQFSSLLHRFGARMRDAAPTLRPLRVERGRLLLN